MAATPGTPVPTDVVFGLVGLLQRYVASWDEPADGTQEEVSASRQLMAVLPASGAPGGLAALIEAFDARETAEAEKELPAFSPFALKGEEGQSDESVVRR
jgi:hypothetical protein